MGTNYYRIVSEKEMESRRKKLLERIKKLQMTPKDIESGFISSYENDELGFYSYETYSPWDYFLKETSVHLGKRSMGWKFAWNHNNWKYYKNRSELIHFIFTGRVVDEYGQEFLPEDFFKMAVDWCEDGKTNDSYLKDLLDRGETVLYPEHYNDIIVDGLRFMNTVNFS